MRFVVLLFGLIGVILTAAGGLTFFMNKEVVALAAEHGVPPGITNLLREPDSLTGQPHLHAALFCFIAAGLGLAGVFLAFLRCGGQGSLLMLIPVLGAGVVNPVSLPFSALQLFSALLALFVGPLPINAEPEEDD